MPWTISNPPAAIKNKSKGTIEAGAKAGNDTLARGQTDEEAVLAAVIKVTQIDL
jgi:hypothetical protein